MGSFHLERRTVSLNQEDLSRRRDSLPRGGDLRCRSRIRLICVSGLSGLSMTVIRRHAAAAHFRVSVSFVVNLMKAFRAGKPRAQAERRTPPRQARTASGVSFGEGRREGRHHHAGTGGRTGRRHRREGRSRLAFALAHPQRLSLQKKLCWPASKIVPTSSRRARNGPRRASRGCGLSRIGWSSSTRPERPPR